MTFSQQIPVATLGVPRFGRQRELKFALESYWSGTSSAGDLLTTSKALRAASWEEQRDRGVSKIPSNDFSLYDHVLDTAAMVGAIPSRYGWNSGEVPLDIYFAMARGNQGQTEDCAHAGHQEAAHGAGVTAMEMTKWFDTNYHYIVPELDDDQTFALSSTKPVDYFLEAKALGIHTRPVILGPITSSSWRNRLPKGSVPSRSYCGCCPFTSSSCRGSSCREPTGCRSMSQRLSSI